MASHPTRSHLPITLLNNLYKLSFRAIKSEERKGAIQNVAILIKGNGSGNALVFNLGKFRKIGLGVDIKSAVNPLTS